MVPELMSKNRKFPSCPPGKKTEIPKNPFHRQTNINMEENPHTGQMAINSETTATTPATAPMGINFGL